MFTEALQYKYRTTEALQYKYIVTSATLSSTLFRDRFLILNDDTYFMHYFYYCNIIFLILFPVADILSFGDIKEMLYILTLPHVYIYTKTGEFCSRSSFSLT